MKEFIKSKWETSKPLVIGVGALVVALVFIAVRKVFKGSSKKSGVNTVNPK